MDPKLLPVRFRVAIFPTTWQRMSGLLQVRHPGACKSLIMPVNSSLRGTIRFLIQESLESIRVFLRSLFWLLLVADGIPVVLLSDRDDSHRFAPFIIEKKVTTFLL